MPRDDAEQEPVFPLSATVDFRLGQLSMGIDRENRQVVLIASDGPEADDDAQSVNMTFDFRLAQAEVHRRAQREHRFLFSVVTGHGLVFVVFGRQHVLDCFTERRYLLLFEPEEGRFALGVHRFQAKTALAWHADGFGGNEDQRSELARFRHQ
jgi:hypothetical protein